MQGENVGSEFIPYESIKKASVWLEKPTNIEDIWYP